MNNIYAKFTDIFDSPEEPRAVFHPDGKIEIVAPNEESTTTSTEDVSDKRRLTAFNPPASLRRKVILFSVLCILVVILLVITLANLVLLVQNQSQIARNSESLMQRTEDHPITTDHINKTVNEILEVWGGGVLTHLQAAHQMDAFDLEKEMNYLLSNLSYSIIARLRVELGFSQSTFQRHIFRVIGNLSTVTVNRLKEELEIDPVHLEKAVHRALNNLTERSLALIRGICEIAYEGKCYWVVKAGIIPYKQAEGLCEVRGAQAANIYNKGHYKAMMSYIRKKMSPMNSVWLGMTRDTSTGRIYYFNGTESTLKISWAANYPVPSTTAVHMGLLIPQNESDTTEGFFNDETGNYRLGILCEL